MLNNILQAIRFLKDYWGSIKSYIKSNWKTLIIGASIPTIVLFYLFYRYYPILINFGNHGQKIGNYHILKGETLDIAVNELSIRFNKYIYRQMGNGDSTFCFPSFDVWSPKLTYGIKI